MTATKRAGVVWYLQMNWGLERGHRAIEKGGLSVKERDRGQNARRGEPARPSGDWWAGR